MHNTPIAPAPESATDAALVERAARGDHAAFARIIDRYDSRLRHEARRMLRDDEAVDDLLQEAYVQMFRALGSFRGESSLATWLHRIIHNACLDELRRRRRRSPVVALEAEQPSTAPGPADVAIERASFESAVAALPPAQRLAVLLVDAYGLDYARLRPRSASSAERWHPGFTAGERLCENRSVAPRDAAVVSGAVAIRVIFADDHYLVREAVRRLIEVQDDLELAAVCEDQDTLLAAIDEHAPDVVVSDIRMPPTRTDEGIQVAQQLRRTKPDVGVVVLSQYADPAYAVALLEGGTAGRAYLLKERISDSEELLDAIREVARGRSVIDAEVVSTLLTARSRGASSLDRLTPREREVLSHMAQGRNNSAIAETLVLTERAVQKHINSIFSKLDLSEEVDVHRRVKAVLLFLSDRLEGSPS